MNACSCRSLALLPPPLLAPRWEGILNLFKDSLPPYKVVYQFQDEPRVVFNTRDPAMSPRAYDLDDPDAFKQGPHPTSVYFGEDGKCRLLDSDRGLAKVVNENISFLISSQSTGFTTSAPPCLRSALVKRALMTRSFYLRPASHPQPNEDLAMLC